ncbi:MAG: dihydropyrimidinase [Anaerolineae bacterium]|nr:dihydropyrimidinase [Anaerolineae bacterium]
MGVSMLTLIKYGTLVTEEKSLKADLLIDDDKIIQIAEKIEIGENMKVVDATGLFVLPGGVDVHVHLDLPMFGTVSSDDHYTGTKAAAFGGTTTVIDFVSQDCDDLLKNVRVLKEKAASKAAVDYSFHANITHLTDAVEKDIPLLVQEGISSIKVFTAYNNRLRLQDGEIFKVMRIARDHGILTMLHAENGDVIEIMVQEAIEARHFSPDWHAKTRPSWGAVESVMRASAISAMADAPLYIVHMNAGGEVDLLEYAQTHGLKVFGETCPQYLFFTEDDLAKPDSVKWICSPPMRTKQDQVRLWQGLEEGIVQTIATDHCPFFFDGTKPIMYEGNPIAIAGKELGKGDFTKIPNGLPGVGDRMPVLWTEMVGSGRFTANQFVKLMSSNPAKLFGMYPQKGTLQVGSDADVVLWDPNKNLQYGVAYSQQRTDYNLYEGWNLKGFPVSVFSRGELIVEHGKWLGKPGRGKFIPRRPFNPDCLG